MKVLVINGPNLNMLGIREKHIYGTETYMDLKNLIHDYCQKEGIEVDIFQSNHEGALETISRQPISTKQTPLSSIRRRTLIPVWQF